MRSVQSNTFNCWWQAVFRILISFIISSWMCSIKHSSHLDIVEMCCMSAMIKIKLHSDQKFHHQYAACSGVHPLPLKKVLHYAENVSYPLIIYKIFWNVSYPLFSNVFWNVSYPLNWCTKMFHTPFRQPGKCFVPRSKTLRPGMQAKKWTPP